MTDDEKHLVCFALHTMKGYYEGSEMPLIFISESFYCCK